MTFEEFDKITEAIFIEVRKMRDQKGREYAQTADRFDNFNRLAARLQLSRLKVWHVYFTKHLDSIETFINKGETYSGEGIQGRIIDAITYLTLLAGMIGEDAERTIAGYGVSGKVTLPSAADLDAHMEQVVETFLNKGETWSRVPLRPDQVNIFCDWQCNGAQCRFLYEHQGPHSPRT